MLANGTGKVRASRTGQTRNKATWRLLFLSAGEISLSQHMNSGGLKATAGQEVRMVDLPSNAGVGRGLFEDLHDYKDGDAFARTIKEVAYQYYGTPIREFIRRICDKPDELPQALKKTQHDFLQKAANSDSDGQVERVARRCALVAAAGELATAMGVTGWSKDEASDAALKCFRDWIADRGGEGSQEKRKAISQVRHFIELHGESRFTDWDKGDQSFDRPTINRAGFRRSENEGIRYYVFPEAFRSEMCEGLAPTFVANALKEAGMLVEDSEGKNQVTRRLPELGTKRVYLLTDKVYGGDNED